VSEPPGSEPAERVTLTLPGERRYVGIVRLFVGGLAARLDLGYDTMDDLQLALENVVERSAPAQEITLDASIQDGAVSILVGPLERDPFQADGSEPDSLELQRLLSTLVPGTGSITREDGCWLHLDVPVPTGSGSA
jgi:hypothetical protein